MASTIESSLTEHLATIELVREQLQPVIAEVAGKLSTALRSGGELLICGNGGSAADAQHFAAELVGRFEKERKGLPAIALTTDAGLVGHHNQQETSLLKPLQRLRHMSQRLQKYGVRLSGIYVCPHHPTAGTGQYLTVCNCRKGEPGMLLQAAQELTIDLQQSYMVGDKEADIQAGQAAGCRSILVQTGYGCSDTENAQRAGAKIVADLTEAAEQILAEQRF